jgi:hypothetical protein
MNIGIFGTTTVPSVLCHHVSKDAREQSFFLTLIPSFSSLHYYFPLFFLIPTYAGVEKKHKKIVYL